LFVMTYEYNFPKDFTDWEIDSCEIHACSEIN
jgi:hypothetical protein